MIQLNPIINNNNISINDDNQSIHSSSIINENDHDLEDNNHNNNLFNNKKATIFSCYINIANTILGSGILGLPYAFR